MQFETGRMPQSASGGTAGPLDDTLYTEAQVAQFYHVSVKTIQGWRVTAKGPRFLKLGKGLRAAVRYRHSDLVRYLSECERSSTSEHSAGAGE